MRRRRFIVANSYGMGAEWALVWARSSEELQREFPELTIVDDWPAWAGEEQRRRIEQSDTYDLDTDKDKGLLGYIRRERAGSASH